ncbi:hypothetical protein O6H91_15G023500 [Diphasiastrum complanatum]|uniref:Uncharacterized protein n=1 Tax=Diphasiastrum complanatum TaxID=34168 RepID=A0ACC2BGN5_DIPCM|nr:hypothetical protein O6H91_15G023500 [Diphasiastrum complanatum]
MTKTSFKAKYDTHSQSLAGTLTVGAGELKLKATCTDATFVNGSNLKGLSLGIEKPGFFMFDYDVPSNAPRFQFMSSAHVVGKQLKLTYIHSQKHDATFLEAALALDARNKLTTKYSFTSEKAHLKYSYTHGGNTTLEPAYDFSNNSWSFGISQKITADNIVKMSFDDHRKTMAVEWNREPKSGGPLKILATIPVNDSKSVKVLVEKTWKHES